MFRKLIRRLSDRRDLSLDKMWFLQDGGARLAESRLDTLVKKSLEELGTNGITVLRSNVPPEICDDVVRDFRNYCKGHPESENFKDQHSLYERLASLHLISEAARRIAFNPSVAKILEAAFQKPFVVVGSLYFDKGSTQSIHRDTPAFFTNPLNHYFGVWTALEDIAPGTGPLVYYLKGHTVAPDEDLIRNASINSQNYFKVVVDECRRSGLELVEYYPKKGDTLIWHPALPHGGAPIQKPGVSRRSIVFHYIPRGVSIYGANVFFDKQANLRDTANYKTIRYENYEAIDQGQPRFFHNRYEGNFDEF